jgi:hypothetical protein
LSVFQQTRDISEGQGRTRRCLRSRGVEERDFWTFKLRWTALIESGHRLVVCLVYERLCWLGTVVRRLGTDRVSLSSFLLPIIAVVQWRWGARELDLPIAPPETKPVRRSGVPRVPYCTAALAASRYRNRALSVCGSAHWWLPR